MPGRRFLIKKQGGKRTFNVHIFEKDHPDIERHLRFRDYLRTHPEERDAYSRLKKELVSESQDDIEQYCWGKEEFIKSIEVKSSYIPNMDDCFLSFLTSSRISFAWF
jgi:GrpB-like predicted nucleotidyltransferase (UPF0157 family)